MTQNGTRPSPPPEADAKPGPAHAGAEIPSPSRRWAPSVAAASKPESLAPCSGYFPPPWHCKRHKPPCSLRPGLVQALKSSGQLQVSSRIREDVPGPADFRSFVRF